jgi:autotransporter-associated beta strand protein
MSVRIQMGRAVGSIKVRAAVAAALLTGVGVSALSADAAVVLKANNADNLNLGSSWVGGAVPGSGDVAAWDGTVTAANATALGGDLSWQGIQIANPGGAVTVSSGNVLTLGASGIDMSAATQNLTLNDDVTLGAAQTWAVAVGRTLQVGGLVTAASGNTLTKSGDGTLLLTANNTGLAADISLKGGVLAARAASSTDGGGRFGSSTISMADGTRLHLDNFSSSVSTFVNSAVTVASGATATLTSDSAGNGYSGSVSGDATSTLVISSAGGAQVSLNGASNIQQFGNVLGTVRVASGASLRFSATSGLNNGGAAATFDLLGSVEMRNTGTAHFGALTGSGTINGTTGADGTATYVVGEKNVDSTFDGVIKDNTSVRVTRLQKSGTGTLTLTGANTYTSTTTVNAGTLLVNGTHTGAGNYTVAAAGTLGGTGSINLAADTGLVTVSGKLTPGSATAIESLDVGVGSLTLAGSADFQVDLAAGQADKVNVGNVLTYGGVLNVAFSGSGADGSAFDLFDFTSESGAFSQVNFTGLSPQQTASFDPTTGVVTISSAAVPEPAALSVIGLAALALGGRRRRK